MGTVKPWQIVVLVLSLVGVGVMAFLSFSKSNDTPTQSDVAWVVDVRSGELFEAPYPERRPVRYPAKNPTSGAESLFPAFPAGDDKWKLDTRYMARIRADKDLKSGLIIDAKSGQVAVANTKPIKADVFGVGKE